MYEMRKHCCNEVLHNPIRTSKEKKVKLNYLSPVHFQMASAETHRVWIITSYGAMKRSPETIKLTWHDTIRPVFRFTYSRVLNENFIQTFSCMRFWSHDRRVTSSIDNVT